MSRASTRITLARRPSGAPVPEDFATETVNLPEPAEGEVLVAVTHLSLDPYMRGRMEASGGYAASVDIGEVMVGQGVGRVVESRAAGLAEGDLVTGMTGWASHAVLKRAEVRFVPHRAVTDRQSRRADATASALWRGLHWQSPTTSPGA